MQQAASLDFFFFGGARVTTRPFEEIVLVIVYDMMARHTHRPWLQWELCFTRLGVRLA